jgi:Na+/melibiose symporter-like transporter
MRQGDVLRMVVAQGASTLGDAAATVTLALRLHDTTHSGWLLAALMFAILGPSVACAPAAGRVVGKLGPRRAFVLAACLQAAAVSALAAVTGPAPTLALAVVVGAGFAAAQPAALTLLPSVVREDGLTRANSWLKSADWAGWMAGPLIGGALVTVGAARLPLLLDGLSFVIAGALIAAVRPGAAPAGEPGPAGQPDQPQPQPESNGWRAGLRYAVGDRPLAALLLIATIAGVALAMASIAEVFLARDVLRAGPLGYAALGAAFMGGTVAGALLTPRLSRFPALTSIGFLAPAGAGIALTGLAGTITQALACYALAGLAAGVQANACRSMVQRHVVRQVPGDLHAQVFSVFVAATIGAQLAGFVLGAAVIQAAGARPAMWLAGGGAALAGLVGLRLGQARSTGLLGEEVQA